MSIHDHHDDADLIDAGISAPALELPPTPTAEDLKRIMRAQNWKTLAIAVPLLLLGSLSLWLTASGRTASKDSFNATAVQLANQERSACITERRNAQAEAIGRETIAAHRAQAAGLLEHNEAEALKQSQIVAQNADLWETATKSLSPEVLNQPKPLGCGPPILTLEDLKNAQEEP